MSIEEKLQEYRSRKIKQSTTATEHVTDSSSTSASQSGTRNHVERSSSSSGGLFSLIYAPIGALVSFVLVSFHTLVSLIVSALDSRMLRPVSQSAVRALHYLRNTRPYLAMRNYVHETFGDATLFNFISVKLAIKLLAWSLVYILFIYVEFGAVYFIFSLLCLVYFTTRSGPPRDRREGPSAYSVFNPGCERLEGTFTTEQFERELRFGAASVH